MQDTIWANDGDLKIATIADLPWVESPSGKRHSDFDTEQANARLIAAAPDLLAACQRALHLIEPLKFENMDHFGVVADLKDALVKAGIKLDPSKANPTDGVVTQTPEQS